MPKKITTKLSHEQLVGVKCNDATVRLSARDVEYIAAVKTEEVVK